jgi:hypothetical protein
MCDLGGWGNASRWACDTKTPTWCGIGRPRRYQRKHVKDVVRSDGGKRSTLVTRTHAPVWACTSPRATGPGRWRRRWVQRTAPMHRTQAQACPSPPAPVRLHECPWEQHTIAAVGQLRMKTPSEQGACVLRFTGRASGEERRAVRSLHARVERKAWGAKRAPQGMPHVVPTGRYGGATTGMGGWEARDDERQL